MSQVKEIASQDFKKRDTLTYSASTIKLYDMLERLDEESRRGIIRRIGSLLSDE